MSPPIPLCSSTPSTSQAALGTTVRVPTLSGDVNMKVGRKRNAGGGAGADLKLMWAIVESLCASIQAG